MSTIGQIKGVLLEEVVLYFLRISGYRTVSEPTGDGTLRRSGAGLCVRGRGAEHQIDAIADFSIHQPFTNPQRLLVEAKCYHAKWPITLPVARNAIGVLKDVAEFWSSPPGVPTSTARYHYQYALFATSDFTIEAQRYAYAHDIHLVPLRRSVFFSPIIEEIEKAAARMARYAQTTFSPHASRRFDVPINLRDLRSTLRHILQPIPETGFVMNETIIDGIAQLVYVCQRFEGALIAILGTALPLFLIPAPDLNLANLDAHVYVRIYWDQAGWYIRSAHDDRLLFSFDLPVELFHRYADAGALSPKRAIAMKGDWFGEFQALASIHGDVRLFNFHLDADWISELREQAGTIRQPREGRTSWGS